MNDIKERIRAEHDAENLVIAERMAAMSEIERANIERIRTEHDAEMMAGSRAMLGRGPAPSRYDDPLTNRLTHVRDYIDLLQGEVERAVIGLTPLRNIRFGNTTLREALYVLRSAVVEIRNAQPAFKRHVERSKRRTERMMSGGSKGGAS